MSAAGSAEPSRLERLLAVLLRQGTRVATFLIIAGIATWELSPRAGVSLVDDGLALFVLLPVARVAVMMTAFATARDYRFAALAACVLAVIAAGALVSVR